MTKAMLYLHMVTKKWFETLLTENMSGNNFRSSWDNCYEVKELAVCSPEHALQLLARKRDREPDLMLTFALQYFVVLTDCIGTLLMY